MILIYCCIIVAIAITINYIILILIHQWEDLKIVLKDDLTEAEYHHYLSVFKRDSLGLVNKNINYSRIANNKKLMLELIKHESYTINYIGFRLQNLDFYKEALYMNPEIINEKIPEEIKLRSKLYRARIKRSIFLLPQLLKLRCNDIKFYFG